MYKQTDVQHNHVFIIDGNHRLAAIKQYNGKVQPALRIDHIKICLYGGALNDEQKLAVNEAEFKEAKRQSTFTEKIASLRLLYKMLPKLFANFEGDMAEARSTKCKFTEIVLGVSENYFPSYRWIPEAPMFLLLDDKDYNTIEPLIKNFGLDNKHWGIFFFVLIRNKKFAIFYLLSKKQNIRRRDF